MCKPGSARSHLVLDLRFAQPEHAAQLLGRHTIIEELAHLPERETQLFQGHQPVEPG